jgi:hypothetical protein
VSRGGALLRFKVTSLQWTLYTHYRRPAPSPGSRHLLAGSRHGAVPALCRWTSSRDHGVRGA